MKYRRRKIKIKYYAPFSRRAVIFDAKENIPYLRLTALSKNQYEAYRKSLLLMFGTVAEIGLDEEVVLVIKPWMVFFWQAFLRGGFKSPVVIVDKELVSAGVVPSAKKIKEVVYRAEARHRFLENDS